MERLAQVIVRPEPQAGHAVPWRSRRSQHQHHHGVVALGDSPADHVAVHAGEVPVQNDDVIGIDCEFFQRVRPVIGDIGRYPLVSHAFSDVVSEAMDILDDEHSHRCPATGSSITTLRPPSGRAVSRNAPPCAAAIALTIDRPRPAPWPLASRSAPMRWNGSPSNCTSFSPRTSPPFSITRRAPTPSNSLEIWTAPPSTLCRTALSITFATMSASSTS